MGNNPVNRVDPNGQFSLPELTATVSIYNILNSISLTHGVFSVVAVTVALETFKPGFEAIDLATQLASRCSGPKCVSIATALYQRGTSLIALGSAQVQAAGDVIQTANALQSLGRSLLGIWNAAGALVTTGRVVVAAGDALKVRSAISAVDGAVQNLQEALNGRTVSSQLVKSDSRALLSVLDGSSRTVLKILSSGDTSAVILSDSVFDAWLDAPF